MLYEVHEVSEGQTVWLYPHTKGASAACHAMRQVKVMHDPKKHWPYVVVEWKEGGVDRWEKVHRDNIKKKPPSQTGMAAQKKQGDTSGNPDTPTDRKWQRKLALPGKIKPIQLAEGEEQGTLF